jgi:hypothetical protein
MDADTMIATLGLIRHPEGGYYRETFRDVPADGGRGALTSIHFLLASGDRSHWHRIDATEVWNFHAGAAMRLSTSIDGERIETVDIGGDPVSGGVYQAVVRPGVWQSAESLGEWSLVGCSVAPAFDFAGFELAPPDWSPGRTGVS